MILRPIKLIADTVRNVSTKPITNGNIKPVILNRNPRNLERLRLVRKPCGYDLDKINVEFWHRLAVTSRSRHVVAELIHNTGKVVVMASTNEWAIRKFLFSAKDKQAYIILARVFAERCLESGLTTFASQNITGEDTNMQAFFKVLVDEGLTLEEPPFYDVHNVWYKNKEKKPWTVLEDDM